MIEDFTPAKILPKIKKSSEGGLYNVGDTVEWKKDNERFGIGKITWKNQVDDNTFEYAVSDYNYLLWEEEIIRKLPYDAT